MLVATSRAGSVRRGRGLPLELVQVVDQQGDVVGERGGTRGVDGAKPASTATPRPTQEQHGRPARRAPPTTAGRCCCPSGGPEISRPPDGSTPTGEASSPPGPSSTGHHGPEHRAVATVRCDCTPTATHGAVLGGAVGRARRTGRAPSGGPHRLRWPGHLDQLGATRTQVDGAARLVSRGPGEGGGHTGERVEQRVGEREHQPVPERPGVLRRHRADVRGRRHRHDPAARPPRQPPSGGRRPYPARARRARPAPGRRGRRAARSAAPPAGPAAQQPAVSTARRPSSTRAQRPVLVAGPQARDRSPGRPTACTAHPARGRRDRRSRSVVDRPERGPPRTSR